MANTESGGKVSQTTLNKTVSNGATVSLSTTYAVAISEVDVTKMDRMSVQIRNVDNSKTLTAQVFGSIYPAPSGVGTASPTVDSYWVQIGDDISVGTSSGALKTVSTTALKRVAVRIKCSSSTLTFPIDDCVLFAEGKF